MLARLKRLLQEVAHNARRGWNDENDHLSFRERIRRGRTS